VSVRIASWLAAAGCALALAGCGGDSEEATTSGPVIPAPIAEDLASQSDRIADLLEAGDLCGAAQEADVLLRAADEAIQDGQIPQALQGELQKVAIELQNTVNCPEPEPEKDKDKGKGNGKGDGNGNGNGEGSDTDATTVIVITTG
jgi:hypothetical protein